MYCIKMLVNLNAFERNTASFIKAQLFFHLTVRTSPLSTIRIPRIISVLHPSHVSNSQISKVPSNHHLCISKLLQTSHCHLASHSMYVCLLLILPGPAGPDSSGSANHVKFHIFPWNDTCKISGSWHGIVLSTLSVHKHIISH